MLQKKEAPAGCSQGQGPSQCVPDKDDFAIECPKLQDFCDGVIKDTSREIVSASIYKTIFDNQPLRVREPLVTIIGEKHETRNKKDGRLFSPATIKENKTRSSENVELIHFSVFDLDHKAQKELINISDSVKGLAYIAYTTFSHFSNGKNDQCIRLVLLYTRPITKDEHLRLYPFLGSLIGAGYDQAATDPSRMFYCPAVPYERQMHSKVTVQNGYSVDVDSALKAAESRGILRYDSNFDCDSTIPTLEQHPWIKHDYLTRNCEAFRRLDKERRFRQLTCHEGFFVATHESQFKGGTKHFIKHTKGWGDSKKDLQEITAYIRKYPPHSCLWAQRNGVCTKDSPEACMVAEQINGKRISPSPTRFITHPFNYGEHFQETLKKFGVPDAE
jgi:hypothetical protein